MRQLTGILGPSVLAIGAGISFVIQQGVNSDLRTALGSAAWAGFVSYLGGTLCMLVLAYALHDTFPPASAIVRSNWWAWTGGLFGAIYIAISIFILPRLGAATFVALLVAGQMLGSLVLDSYGLLGAPEHAVGPGRILGAILLIGGVVLIRQ
jgi:transporter family-2 protein